MGSFILLQLFANQICSTYSIGFVCFESTTSTYIMLRFEDLKTFSTKQKQSIALSSAHTSSKGSIRLWIYLIGMRPTTKYCKCEAAGFSSLSL